MRLILGGARSGKSSFAEQLAKDLRVDLKTNVAYIATSIAFDDGMKDRIKKHRESRPADWYTIEQYKNFKEIEKREEFTNSNVILLDCMTLMVSNLLLEYQGDFDKITTDEIDQLEKYIIEQVDELLSVCNIEEKEFIVVSNEVGLGLVPSYKLGSIFRDIAGRINQRLAKEAKEVYLLTAGIPLKLK